MPNIDLSNVSQISPIHLRLLQGIEQAMKNHDFAPLTLINQISNISNLFSTLSDLCKLGLISHVGGPNDGYQLTYLGFDYLAISILRKRQIIDMPLRKIGVGKEAEVWICSTYQNKEVCLKLHKLGLNSFKNARTLRNYSDKQIQWWKMSQLAAVREFGFGTALKQRGMNVVQMIDQCKHCVVMDLVNGVQMSRIRGLDAQQARYLGETIYGMMMEMLQFGVIHGDCNEYNVIVEFEEGCEFCEETEEITGVLGKEQQIFKNVTLIDFPQLIQATDDEAEYQFDRDVNSFEGFLNRRFGANLQFKRFAEIEKVEILNEIEASEKFARGQKREAADNLNENEIENADENDSGEKDENEVDERLKMAVKVRKVDLKGAAKQQVSRENQKRNQAKKMQKGQVKGARDRYGGNEY